MDIGEETGDDHAETIARNGPGGVLAAAAAAKVLACHQYAAAVAGVVEHELRIGLAVFLVAPVAEQIVSEKLFVSGGRLQKTGGNYLVGVHILQRKGHASALNYIEFLFHSGLH